MQTYGRPPFLKFISLFLLLSFSFTACQKPVTEKPKGKFFIRSADLSKLPELTEEGAIFRDASGQRKEALQIFRSAGLNIIRVRLWVNPSGTHSSLKEVTVFSQKIQAMGLKVWLDLHYSDTWADPGKQTMPKAWKNLSFTQLKDTVYTYTLRVVRQIHPQYVQIGNEINNGFLWDDGNINHPQQFIALLQKGIAAVRRADTHIRILLHYAGYYGAETFFSLLQKYHIDYDLIGLSYYPWWHGKSLDVLQQTILRLETTHLKPVVIAETAYPFTLSWNDNTNNFVGNRQQLIQEYPATAEGQKAFLSALRKIINETPYGGGLCYWEPEWITIKRAHNTTGSPWENLALFDFQNRALPAMAVFQP